MAKRSNSGMKTVQQQSFEASCGPDETMQLEVTLHWVRRPHGAEAPGQRISYGEDPGALGQKQPGGNSLRVGGRGSATPATEVEEGASVQRQTMVVACGPNETVDLRYSVEAVRSKIGGEDDGEVKAQGADPGQLEIKGAGNSLGVSKIRR